MMSSLSSFLLSIFNSSCCLVISLVLGRVETRWVMMMMLISWMKKWWKGMLLERWVWLKWKFDFMILLVSMVGSTSEKWKNEKSENPCVRPECGMKYLPIHIHWEWEKWKSECLSWTDLTVTCCLRVVYVSQCLTRPQGLSSNLTSSVTHTPVSPVIDVTDDIQIVITFGTSKTKTLLTIFCEASDR